MTGWILSLLIVSLPQVDVWKEFTAALRAGGVTAERVRPYQESLKGPILGFLASMKEKAVWQEWEATPETHRVGNQVHYLIPLTFDGHKDTYCFTFLIENGRWYFQHLESISIRLDKTPPPPTSSFPDLPEAKKAWMRAEAQASAQTRLFNFLSKEKGRDFAFDWFKDGAGYFLAAKTWVPFVPASRAFVLYLCWEQANLHGDRVTLEKLDDREAVVRWEPTHFKLYAQTGHLRQQISSEDYRRIFETVWQDRARNAGWALEIEYRQGACVFRLKKGS